MRIESLMDGDVDAVTQAAKEQAIRLLARREHSRLELQGKLAARGYTPEVVDATLAQLAADGLQSDARFVEGYVRSALERGHGERKIRADLQARGVGDQLASASLDLSDADWRRRATQAVCKRFGPNPSSDLANRAKQLRFLLRRGFSPEIAGATLRDMNGAPRVIDMLP